MISDIIQATITALVPLMFLAIPGIFIARSEDTFFTRIANVILWSVVVSILSSLLVLTLNLPVYMAGILIASFSLLELWHKRSTLNAGSFRRFLLPATAILVIYTAFSIPFLQFHNGLPTGDSQKTIFWANHILATNTLPDYSLSRELMNRDPVDFYTPGLHSYAALFMQLSQNPLTVIGFMSIALAIAAAFIGAGIAETVFTKSKFKDLIAVFTILFTLTHFRFLRYIREPGYHLQNIAGEVLLFGLLLLGLRLLKRLRWSDAVLFVLTGVALLFTHQLSAFLAAFLFIPIVLIWLWQNRASLLLYVTSHRYVWVALVVFSLTVFGLLIELNLHQKVTHIFTTSPHLLHLTLLPTEYAPMMGGFWLLGGLFGLVLAWVLYFKNHSLPLLAFCVSTTVLFILSQGPRLGINIPPVRVLFYSVVPLSITLGYFLTELVRSTIDRYHIKGRALAFIVIAIAAIISVASSLTQAYTLSHDVRTNSTLTSQQQHLISFLQEDGRNDAVLIDDYNRRSSSWLLLGGNAMFTRIGADIERQMNESHQSKVRYDLYLAQLDYEKIFSMGSSAAIVDLMKKHDIHYVTGIDRTSNDSFAQNRALLEVGRAGDIILYRIKDEQLSYMYPSTILTWLLRSSTLANDIGDRQDTFSHLPASLRATRLSEPQEEKNVTWRTTSAPYIPLTFSVGNYTEALYDREKTGYADTALELFVDFEAKNIENVSIITPSGKTLPITSRELLKIKGNDAPWDDDGFIEIILYNPNEESIDIRFIALGLSHTP